MSMDDTIAGPGGSDRRLTVAEYVLGVLEEPERTAIARAIERDPAMAGEARFWEDHFADLNAAYEEVSPPAGIRSALERRLFGAPAKARWYDSVAFWRGTAAAALAVAVIGIGLNVLSPVVAPVPEAERALLAALAAEDVDLNVFALYEPDAEVLRITAAGTPAPAGQDFELWYIAGDAEPVSIGLLDIGQGLTLPVSAELRAAFDTEVALAISIEPEGGSPEPVPTGPVIAVAPATVI